MPHAKVMLGEIEHDWLVPVKGKLILFRVGPPLGTHLLGNAHGDDWKKEGRKKMAKLFPAIRLDD